MIQCLHISKLMGNYADEKRHDCNIIGTGIKPLDRIIGGFQSGELVTIAGRPLMGKKELCLYLIHRWAVEDKIPVAVTTWRIVTRLLPISCWQVRPNCLVIN